MASFTLDRETFEDLRPDPGHPAEKTRSWEYGVYPKVMASWPLAGGRTVDVYAVAERWNPSYVLVSWGDDGDHAHSKGDPVGVEAAGIPASIGVSS